MKVEYEYTFGLPGPIVWKFIKDETILHNSIPGCKSFVESSKRLYDAEIEIKAGPIQDLFKLKIRRMKEKSPTFYQLQVKGNGDLGEIEGTVDLDIQGFQGGAKLTCKAEAEVTGKMTAVGQRFLEGGANKGLKSFFQSLEKEIKRSLYQSRRRKS